MIEVLLLHVNEWLRATMCVHDGVWEERVSEGLC